jgi:transcription elongation factor Elf1
MGTKSDRLTMSVEEAAIAACQSPLASVKCPLCGATTFWVRVESSHVKSRETSVDLHCSACGARETFRLFSGGAPACWPFERFPLVPAIEKEASHLRPRSAST